MKHPIKGTCEYCGNGFRGSSLKKYCSNSCKQLDYQRRKLGKEKPPKERVTQNSSIGGMSEKTTAKVVYTLHPEYVKGLKEQIQATNDIIGSLAEQKKMITDMLNSVGRIPAQIWCAAAGALLTKIIVSDIEGAKQYSLLLSVGGGIAGYFVGKWMDEKYEKKQQILIPRLYDQVEIINEHIFAANNRLNYYIREQKQLLNREKPIVIDVEPNSVTSSLNNNGSKIKNKGDFSDLMTASEVLGLNFETLPFEGEFLDLMGEPAVNFYAMIHGEPKSGKSTFALRFSNYLTNFGRVLYVASEEGVSKTLQNKIRATGGSNSKLYFLNYPSFEGVGNLLASNEYKFVVFDSVNHMGLKPQDIENLRQKFKGVAFVAIFQATKNGSFKGAKEFEHNVDVVIRISAGKAYSLSRFNGGNELLFMQHPDQNLNFQERTIF